MRATGSRGSSTEARPADRGRRPGRRRRHHRASPRATSAPPTPRRCSSTSGPGTNEPRAGAGGLGRRRPRRLLEAVHARRLPGRPLPGAGRPAALPVPPVDVRRARRLPPDVRPGDPLAAAAADRRRRRGLPRGPGRLQRPGRSRLLGSGPLSDLTARPPSAGAAAARCPAWPAGSTTASARPRSCAARSTRSSPTTGRSCSARSPSTASSSSSCTGVFLTFFFKASPTAGRSTTGSYAPLQGVQMSTRLRVGHPTVVRRAGRPRHAPDPPLGGADLPGDDLRPPAAASSSPARSAGPARSTGSSASRC